jgi:hypothetical protein
VKNIIIISEALGCFGVNLIKIKNMVESDILKKKNDNCKNVSVMYKCNNFIENDRYNENY